MQPPTNTTTPMLSESNDVGRKINLVTRREFEVSAKFFSNWYSVKKSRKSLMTLRSAMSNLRKKKSIR